MSFYRAFAILGQVLVSFKATVHLGSVCRQGRVA